MVLQTDRETETLTALVIHPAVYLNIAALLLTIPAILYALRQPIKRRYHYFFVAFLVIFGIGHYSTLVWANLASSPDDFLFRIHVVNLTSALAPTALYGFIAYFVRSRLSAFQKCVLAGAFAYFLLYLTLAIVDPNFSEGLPVHYITSGYVDSPGPLYPYFDPFGIDLAITIISSIIVAELALFYRSQKAPWLRRQTIWLFAAVLIFLTLLDFALDLNRFFKFSGFFSILWIATTLVMLGGIRRHGFYGVTPVAETATASEPILVQLEDSRCYLARDGRRAFETFANSVKNGRSGLCVTRTFPDVVRKTYGLQTTPIRWLADEKGPETIAPDDLLGLSLTIKDFMAKATKPIVLLQGMEFLVSRDGFVPLQRMVEGLTEANARSGGVLLLPLTPKALDEKEEALLVAETTPLPSIDGGTRR